MTVTMNEDAHRSHRNKRVCSTTNRTSKIGLSPGVASPERDTDRRQHCLEAGRPSSRRTAARRVPGLVIG